MYQAMSPIQKIRLFVPLILLVFTAILIKSIYGYSVNLESNLKMCFYENLNVTESFGINYELIPEPGGVNSGKKSVDLEVKYSKRMYSL